MRRRYWLATAAVGCLYLNLAMAPGAGAQTEAVPAERGAHGGRLAQAGDEQIEMLVDSLGLMQVWLWSTQSEQGKVPANAKATLRGGGDNYSIPLRADSTGLRLVGRFDPHHFRIFEVELSLLLGGKRRSVRLPYPRDLPFHSHH